MTNAFSSVLSLKRNRSTSTSKAHSVGSSEPVSKLSRLKSGLNIFSKISDAITQHQQDHQQFNHYTKRTSFIGILQYFRNDQDTRNKSRLRRKATYDSDGYYEYHQYHQKLNRKQTDARQAERNIHTLPTPQVKKLTSILIKRSGTNPMSQQQQQQHQQLTKVSSRRSNATHVSASNITINSEDLTAKEFADIAGIRILPENDIGEEDEERYDEDPDSLIEIERKFSNGTSTDDDIHMHTVSTASKSYLDYLDEHHRLSVISYVSLQSYSTSSKPKIWDNEFWLNPEEHHHYHQSSRMSRSNSTATHRSNHTTPHEPTTAKKLLDRKPSTVVVVEPPILHELRTRSSEKKADQNSHCVIKKGRFEIHLGDGNSTSGESSCILPTTTASDHSDHQQTATTTTNTASSEGVLEWKRKRKDQAC
ncbi:hypothetical protein MUCCIDRAFT_76610 [Mucor lusitanicus CBS 277.49]|uniref:Uncharacterized protein n=1 Tax=Mucor lusitanicus CBS 277.49 TaxID=747725 RepID=A0A168Q038_MUCCL|nr:hypothetical protein MUCCIDRAFT_76610 [Mucor lusitanicus CBS 277.49]